MADNIVKSFGLENAKLLMSCGKPCNCKEKTSYCEICDRLKYPCEVREFDEKCFTCLEEYDTNENLNYGLLRLETLRVESPFHLPNSDIFYNFYTDICKYLRFNSCEEKSLHTRQMTSEDLNKRSENDFYSPNWIRHDRIVNWDYFIPCGRAIHEQKKQMHEDHLMWVVKKRANAKNK